MHSDRRGRTRSAKWLTATLLGGALVGSVLTACTSASGATTSAGTHPAPAHAQPLKPAVLAASVTTQPASGSQDASPSGIVSASVADGVISSVALTTSAGTVVNGKLSPDKRTWTAGEVLGYGKSYTWSGSAVGADGKAVPIAGSFSTVTPARQISGRLNVGDGQTYGIAIPVALTFSAPVTDQAAVQNALSVTTSVPTTGAWAWLDSQTVHWRPAGYYQPGTQVSVHANLYGVAFAPGVYGKADVSAAFTIGRSQVVQANTQTHRMVVITNGVQSADFPASYGLDSDPGRNTHSGTHVVMGRSPTVFMSNPTYHYTNVEVHWAVRISNNGEFIHAAPWSVGQQGKVNVSHGCVNLSDANAIAYYNTILVGDPVEVTGSAVPLGPSDGDFYDWTLTWAQWQAKSALTA
ncbi:MAG TPA: Ig-like domain-containing protein [Pseudonocardiaceae bacterium]|nr:Ig-like domain-containing protein [Pseudonocardiaceae bacterium]